MVFGISSSAKLTERLILHHDFVTMDVACPVVLSHDHLHVIESCMYELRFFQFLAVASMSRNNEDCISNGHLVTECQLSQLSRRSGTATAFFSLTASELLEVQLAHVIRLAQLR